MQPDCTDPAWRAEADSWVVARREELGLAPTGPFEQPHLRPWATALRIPTDGGDVWFKANMPGLEHEARLVAVLAERRPDCIAHDAESGWMLMGDAGTRLRELVEAERELTRWLEILPLYAGVQVDLTPAADELVAFGVPTSGSRRCPSRWRHCSTGGTAAADVSRRHALSARQLARADGLDQRVITSTRALALQPLPATRKTSAVGRAVRAS